MVIAFLCLSKCLRDCSFMSWPAIRQLLVATGEVYDSLRLTFRRNCSSRSAHVRLSGGRIILRSLRVNPETTVLLLCYSTIILALLSVCLELSGLVYFDCASLLEWGPLSLWNFFYHILSFR